jgi:uncharacterized protein involved in high-affinity Fe2+ transport
MLKDGGAAGGVGDLDLAGALLDPIEKELCGGAAHAAASADLHIERGRRGLRCGRNNAVPLLIGVLKAA